MMLTRDDQLELSRYKQIYAETKDPDFRKAIEYLENGKQRPADPVRERIEQRAVNALKSMINEQGISIMKIPDMLGISCSAGSLSGIMSHPRGASENLLNEIYRAYTAYQRKSTRMVG